MERTLVINDPVHGIMEFNDPKSRSIRRIMDHPLLQRLRHIKQLGMADLVFPGAVHTRFSHSLGAAFLAKKLLEQTTSPVIQQEWQWYVTVAALTHDIGHGPFSHAFEHLTQNQDCAISHEDWAPYFIEELKSVLDQETVIILNSLMVKDEQENKIPIEQTLIKDIISSQLDADRLDYLLRDSYFCGVSYGRYDLNWLLHCIQAITDEQDRLRLGVSLKGVGVVESFLMARRLMTKNVYHHISITLLQLLTVSFLEECCKAIQEPSLQSLCPYDLKQFLEGLKNYRLQISTKEKFMSHYFTNYKALTDHMIYQWIEIVVSHHEKLPKNIAELGRRLYYRYLPKIIRVPKNKEAITLNMILMLRAEQNLHDWQLGFRQDKFMTYQDHLEPILVKDKKITKITEASFLMDTFAEKKESFSYVYIDKNLLSKTYLLPLLQNLECA